MEKEEVVLKVMVMASMARLSIGVFRILLHGGSLSGGKIPGPMFTNAVKRVQPRSVSKNRLVTPADAASPLNELKRVGGICKGPVNFGTTFGAEGHDPKGRAGPG